MSLKISKEDFKELKELEKKYYKVPSPIVDPLVIACNENEHERLMKEQAMMAYNESDRLNEERQKQPMFPSYFWKDNKYKGYEIRNTEYFEELKEQAKIAYIEHPGRGPLWNIKIFDEPGSTKNLSEFLENYNQKEYETEVYGSEEHKGKTR